MTVAVVGSRSFADRERLFRERDALREEIGDFTLICRWKAGAAALAQEWARERGLPWRGMRATSLERTPSEANRLIADAADCRIAFGELPQSIHDRIQERGIRWRLVYLTSDE